LHKEPRLDEAERDRQFPQLKGLFMIDRDGVVRWSDVERERPGALATAMTIFARWG
jgi:hypothetical protein